MVRVLLSVIVLAASSTPLLAQAAKDTQGAAATRKRLQTKVSVEFKDTRLTDCVKELEGLVEDAGGGRVKFYFALGVSMNLTITYSAKDKTLEEVLDGMFQKNGMGYLVVSLEKDRYDGWIQIKMGKERGYPAGAAPVAKGTDKTPPVTDKPKDKPVVKDKSPVTDAEKAEQTAAARLSFAKELIDAGKTDRGKERLEEIIKTYPDTKAAEEAKKLLAKPKK